eukprot:669419-Hanusia_phi.AAC.1
MACTKQIVAEFSLHKKFADSSCPDSSRVPPLYEGSHVSPAITGQGTVKENSSYSQALEAMRRMGRSIDANGNFLVHDVQELIMCSMTRK